MDAEMDLEVKAILNHFPKNEAVSKRIENFVRNEALAHSRYIFVEDRENRQAGYCTHCQHDVTLPEKTYHNDIVICPHCKSETKVKHDWRGHSKLIDKTYFHYFEKSRKNKEAIVCRGIYAVRNYAGSARAVKTKYEVHTYYIFEMGNSQMMLSWHNRYYCYEPAISYDIRKSVYPRFINYQDFKGINLDISIESVRNAVKGTQFQYSAWEHYYKNHNLADGFVKYFALYAKYPSVEYVTKIGLCNLIEAKIQGPTSNPLYLRGKTLPKVLRMHLNKQDGKDLQEYKCRIDTEEFLIWQLSKKDGSKITLREIMTTKQYLVSNPDSVKKINKYVKVDKIIVYIEKQQQQNKHISLNDWRDYLSDCEKLEFNLNDKNVLFPKNLYNAHQNTIKQVKIKGDAILDKKIQNRLKRLEEKYSFMGEEYLIRPARTSIELINEGKALSHCVGTYANRYAKGTTNICFIRKTAKPDKPYFTIEISNQNNIVQVRGNKNCSPDKLLREFIDEYKNIKLQPIKGDKTA